MTSYTYRPIPVQLEVLVAEESVSTLGSGLGWDKLLPPQQLHTTKVPGSHNLLMHDPYVASVGSALSAALKRASTPAITAHQAAHNPIIPIQQGRADRQPLYCVPGAGANIFDFTHLASALGTAQPVLGLQPRGLFEGQIPHASVEAAARANVRALGLHQPEGDVHLLGHSFGGWVAFEMALQLQADGRRVATLTIVDSEPPGDPAEQPAEYDDREVLIELIRLFDMRPGRPLDLTGKDLAGMNTKQALTLLHKRLIQSDALPHRFRPNTLMAVMRTFAANLRTSYYPKSVPQGPIRIVTAHEDERDPNDARQRRPNRLRSWNDLTPSAEVLHCGRANHVTVLQPPHVDEWVRRLFIAPGTGGPFCALDTQ